MPRSRAQVSLSAGGLGLGGWVAPAKGGSGDEEPDRASENTRV